MRYLSKILIVFILMFSYPLYYVGCQVDEHNLFCRYTFEMWNTSTSVYDTMNNAERLVKFGNPKIHYSNVWGIGNYFHFDGDDYLRDATGNGIIADGAFSLNVPQLTICVVVRNDYTGTPLHYFYMGEIGRDGYFLWWNSVDNRTYLRLRDSTGVILDSSSTQELNKTGWALLTVCYKSGSSGTVNMWFNKTNVLNFTGSTPIPQIEQRFEIMFSQYFGVNCKGDVGFVEIYTHPVNSRWVEGKYNETFGIEWIPSSGAPSAPVNNNAWIIGLIVAIPIIIISLKRGRR